MTHQVENIHADLPRWVCVTSAPYSGSTLLAVMLDMHPEIASVGEMNGYEGSTKLRCSCGEWMEECPFWQQITREMQVRGFVFSPTAWKTTLVLPSHRLVQRVAQSDLGSAALEHVRENVLAALPPFRQFIETRVQRNRALGQSILAVTGKRVIFDSAKEAMRVPYFLRYGAELDLRVLHLVRDVYGFVNSLVKYSHVPAEKAARHWVKRNQHILQERAKFSPDAAHLIRYEDLVREPARVLPELHAFCGVTPQVMREDDYHAFYAAYPFEKQHIIGNSKARKRRESGRRPLVLDEKWRAALTPEQVNTITDIAGEMRAAFGYEPLR